jgi:hypothetical protein
MKLIGQKGLIPVIIVLAISTVAAAAFFASRQIVKPKPTSLVKSTVIVPSATPIATPSPTPSPSPTPIPTPVLKSPSPTPVQVPSVAPSVAPVPVTNTPPRSGFANINVNVEGYTYPVAIVTADLNSTRVIVDTASESDCGSSCPVLSLSDYVSRNGAYAGINGSYFCPTDYPSCAGKTNSFDTLLMNKNKRYFNSDNNVYSTVPAAIFSAGSARFVGQSLEWGRDTGPDSVIANYPLLIAGGNINFTEAPNEPKFGNKAPRTFIAAKGNMVYIGIVYKATMGESAKVLKALGMDGALNLDQGGSTALWHGGYKAGPGRSIPNAILFVNR